MTITADDLVKREVFHCASYLVSALAQGSQFSPHSMGEKDLVDLCNQASELCQPIDDWEEAAIQAGWVQHSEGDWSNPQETMAGGFNSAQELCEHEGIEPYQREIFEHWIISDWLGRKLEALGERVDFDFAGLTIWGRTTTGQGIAMDWVMEQITVQVNAPLAP